MPTLLCNMSIRPNDLMQASTIVATSAARDTSPAIAALRKKIVAGLLLATAVIFLALVIGGEFR